MSTESAPYYWIVCNADNCNRRSPDEYGDEHSAWREEEHARDLALDGDWASVKTDFGWHDYCDDHRNWVCSECAKEVQGGATREQDSMCDGCWAGDS